MKYRVGDFIKYNKVVLRVDKISNCSYYFTIIKNIKIYSISNLSGLYRFSINIFEEFDSELLTDEEKLELL